MIDEDGYYDDPAQREATERLRVQTEARDRDRRDAFGAVAASVNGRLFLWHLLEQCGVWSASYGPDAKFREGQRDIGIRVLREMDRERPGLLFLMSEENQGRQSRYDALTIPQPEPEE